MTRQLLAWVLAVCLSPGLAAARDITAAEEDYIRANAVFFIYHELGHALIEILRLPIFGQEEDAADVMGVVLSEKINTPEDSEAIMLSTADNFAYLARQAKQEGDEPAFWDSHGLDQQRFYTILCLFYGADPKTRLKLATQEGLPAERQASCPGEYQLAEESWGPVLEEFAAKGKGDWLFLTIADAPKDRAQEVLLDAVRTEIGILNQVLDPGQSLDLVFGNCGEPNAFYSADDGQIVICAELAGLFVD